MPGALLLERRVLRLGLTRRFIRRYRLSKIFCGIDWEEGHHDIARSTRTEPRWPSCGSQLRAGTPRGFRAGPCDHSDPAAKATVRMSCEQLAPAAIVTGPRQRHRASVRLKRWASGLPPSNEKPKGQARDNRPTRLNDESHGRSDASKRTSDVDAARDGPMARPQ